MLHFYHQCAASANVNVVSHYMFGPNWPASSVQVDVLKEYSDYTHDDGQLS
jgi:hypothetical protein